MEPTPQPMPGDVNLYGKVITSDGRNLCLCCGVVSASGLVSSPDITTDIKIIADDRDRLAARVAELEAAMNQLLGAGWSIEGGGVIAIDGAMTVAMLAETVAEAKGEA